MTSQLLSSAMKNAAWKMDVKPRENHGLFQGLINENLPEANPHIYIGQLN